MLGDGADDGYCLLGGVGPEAWCGGMVVSWCLEDVDGLLEYLGDLGHL